MNPSDHSQRWRQLDRLLTQYRPYWQLRTFDTATVPWPELRVQLASLDSEQRQQLLHDDQLRNRTLQDWLPGLANLAELCRVPRKPTSTSPAAPARLSNHIPGRKWQQVVAFDQALNDHGLPFLEWCAGKGHLGRLLAHNRQRQVTSLEWQPQLCQSGQQLAERLGLPCRLHAVDVMGPEIDQHLHPAQHAVALHACGKLHIRLLQQASRHRLAALSLSPCCYHLIDTEHYQPLSRIGQSTTLRLERYDLGLAVLETVTAGRRERRLQQRELAWRLGFDQLQRHVRGVDRYLNCPTLPRAYLAGRFEDFCRAMAERRQLQLPTAIDFDRFEQQGQARIATIEQLEIVRQLFRRPLELWLVLDRVCRLEQSGYRVELTEFCDRTLTPRNLLIQAQRICG